VQISAGDMVYCISAILEFPTKNLDAYISDMKNVLDYDHIIEILIG
jgi:hypothetical protein